MVHSALTWPEKEEAKFLYNHNVHPDKIVELIGKPFSIQSLYQWTNKVPLTEERIQELTLKHEKIVKLNQKLTQIVEGETPTMDKQEEVRTTDNKSTGEIEEMLKKYFNTTLEDLLFEPNNLEEKRDLSILYDEYNKIFDMPITDNVKYSLQERYINCRDRKLNAVKILIDAIRFTKRRVDNSVYAFRFKSDGVSTKEEKILSCIIGICKNVVDGRVFRAISETQKKMATLLANVFCVTSLTPQAEEKLMQMITRYDILDIMNKSLSALKNKDIQTYFLEDIEKKLGEMEERA